MARDWGMQVGYYVRRRQDASWQFHGEGADDESVCHVMTKMLVSKPDYPAALTTSTFQFS
jgi:hypothetical protein